MSYPEEVVDEPVGTVLNDADASMNKASSTESVHGEDGAPVVADVDHAEAVNLQTSEDLSNASVCEGRPASSSLEHEPQTRDTNAISTGSHDRPDGDSSGLPLEDEAPANSPPQQEVVQQEAEDASILKEEPQPEVPAGDHMDIMVDTADAEALLTTLIENAVTSLDDNFNGPKVPAADLDVLDAPVDGHVSPDKPPFRLPRLAETQQMRLALQRAHMRNPKEPHVRILYANFSRPCRNKLPKFEWPPPEPQPEPAKVEKPPPTPKVKRRRTTIKPYQFDQHGRAIARQPSLRPAVGPQRLPRAVSTREMHTVPAALTTDGDEGGERVMSRQERMAAIKKALEEAYRGVPEPVPEEPDDQAKRRRSLSLGKGYMRRSTTMSFSTSGSSANVFSPKRGSTSDMTAASKGNVRQRTARRRKGPTYTPARQQQLAECAALAAALRRHELLISESVLERALLFPEEILKPPPPIPVFDAVLNSEIAVVKRSQRAGRHPPLQRRSRPSSKTTRRSDADGKPAIDQSARINTRWSMAELEVIKARLREARERQRDYRHLFPPASVSGASNLVRRLTLPSAQFEHSRTNSMSPALPNPTVFNTKTPSRPSSANANNAPLMYYDPWSRQSTPTRPRSAAKALFGDAAEAKFAFSSTAVHGGQEASA
ncbi:hypothetical protein BC832DRAFT_36457 [Gaertneriomyces semiglobifer]|nr:hypothetical protein BC832DRAFT_36457 [Gaertneriomyces semiglobifer]